MPVDFLRHIVNPTIEKYVKTGVLTSRDSIEIKRMVFEAEEKYRFSIYGGDVANLASYLRSSEFKELINYLKSINATGVLVELISQLKEHYGNVIDILMVIEDITKEIENTTKKKSTLKPMKKRMNLTEPEAFDLVKQIFGASNIKNLKTGIKIELSPHVDLKITPTRNYLKLEIRLAYTLDREDVIALLGKVKEIAEKTSRF